MIINTRIRNDKKGKEFEKAQRNIEAQRGV